MRLLQLIITEQTDTEQEVQATVKDLLITLKAHGIETVNLEQISNELNKIGFDTDPSTLSDTLEDMDLISSIENNIVHIDTEQNTDSEDSSGDDEEDADEDSEEETEEDKVNKQAMNYINRSNKREKNRQKRAAETDIGEQ